MASEAASSEAPEASVSTESRRPPDMSRQWNGASFLTLEHVGYFVLVVVVPALLFASVTAAWELWGNGNRGVDVLLYPSLGIGNSLFVLPALMATAGLLVAVPLMYLLQKRVSAELLKRPGYTGRVAYKLPIYSALAVLVALTLGSLATMLAVVLQSLAMIGVKNAQVGQLYLNDFLPALIALVIFGASAWYVFWYAKGRDVSRMFVSAVAVLAFALAITLFVTTVNTLHTTPNPVMPIDSVPPGSYPYPLNNQ